MKIVSESIDGTGEFSRSKAFGDWQYLLKELDRARKDNPAEDGAYPEEFFQDVELVIRYGNFRKVGKGSSRTAYVFDADPRYVLKFAHNDNGLKQNQTELRNAKRGDYRCMVRILAYDDKDVLIVEDMCRESTYPDWYRIIGIGPNTLSKVVRTVFEKKKSDPSYTVERLLDEIRDFDSAAEVLKKTSAMDDELTRKDHPKVVSCLENLIAAAVGENKEEKWVSMFDLFRFYYDHGLAAMIPEELLYVDQWGVKEGATPDRDALIIVDPGVDDDFRPFAGKSGRVR